MKNREHPSSQVQGTGPTLNSEASRLSHSSIETGIIFDGLLHTRKPSLVLQNLGSSSLCVLATRKTLLGSLEDQHDDIVAIIVYNSTVKVVSA